MAASDSEFVKVKLIPTPAPIPPKTNNPTIKEITFPFVVWKKLKELDFLNDLVCDVCFFLDGFFLLFIF